jgi:hypothetical protein
MNARDLSEPPKYGTTSGCPPPSQHHNYRRLLHTQQRNRPGRCPNSRFWKGVAQITRSRDRIFFASLCSLTLFSINSIRRADRCVSTPPRWFCTALASRDTESSHRSDGFVLETIGEADSQRRGGAAPMTSPRRDRVQTSERCERCRRCEAQQRAAQ